VDNRIIPGGSGIDSFAEIYEAVRHALDGQIVFPFLEIASCILILASTWARLMVQEYAEKLAEIANSVSHMDGYEKYFTRAADGLRANKAMRRVLEEQLKYRRMRPSGLHTCPRQLQYSMISRNAMLVALHLLDYCCI